MAQVSQETKTELIEQRIDPSTAGAIAMSELGAVFKDMGQIMEFAKMMAVSGPAVPPVFRANPGACLAVAIKAHHLGFEPFSFASKCYFVNDQLAYESQLVHAIVIRRGPFTKRPSITYSGEGPERRCHVTLHMREPDGDVTYDSPVIAEIKPQNSPLWKSDPDQQLAYYSVRAAARRYCPDVIMGMYDQEEMAAIAAKDVTPAAPAGKPREDIAARLAAGSRPVVTTVDGTPVSGRAEDGDATPAPKTATSGPSAAENVSLATSASAAPNASPAQATAESAGIGAGPAPSDMFERTMLEELRTALSGVESRAQFMAVEEEFAGAMGLATEETQVLMREELALVEARFPAS